MAVDRNDQKTISLETNEELRIVINDLGEFSIELLNGSAEIFGVDMILNKTYKMTSSLAVLTWRGCSLKLIGSGYESYSVMNNGIVHDVHNHLEDYRCKAEKNRQRGPVVLITGPTDAGKSTLARYLLNYAARLGRKPIYVDLDVGQSSASIPGTISILPIDSPGDIVQGFNESSLYVYFFGYKSPGFNSVLYFLLIKKLGENTNFRMERSPGIFYSGTIIDTCGWVTGTGYKSIVVAARSFKANIVLVLSDKRLCSQLKHDLPSSVEIKFIPKLDGVVERNKTVRSDRREALISEYFYGSKSPLQPYTFGVPFSEMQIFQVLPPMKNVSIDMLDDAHKYISLSPVPISNNLIHHVLAVSYADDIEEEIMLTSVLGFIYIHSIDMDREIVSVLSPQSSLLMKKIFLMGDIQFSQYKS